MKFLGPPSSGSIAGTTFSHNRAGQYTRNRRTPVQTIGTGRRALIRSYFGGASSGWNALTAAQQAAWDSYASLNPITDSLGQSITLTGQQQFVSIYTSCLNTGIAAPTAPPASNAVYTPAVTSFTATVATPVLTILFVAGSTGQFVNVQVSPPMNAGRRYNGTWWQVKTQAATVTTTDIHIPYITQFGLWAIGQKIWYKANPVNASGVIGTPVIGAAIST